MPLEQFLIYCYLRPPIVLNQQKLKTQKEFIYTQGGQVFN